MISYSRLTNEIIWIILNFLHLTYEDKFVYPIKYKLSQTLNIEYSNSDIIQHPLYSAKVETSEFKFEYLLSDLNYDSDLQFILLFQVNNLPIYRINWLLESPKEIYVFHNNVWEKAALKTQLALVQGFENIYTLGFSWQKNILNDSFYQLLISTMEKNLFS